MINLFFYLTNHIPAQLPGDHDLISIRVLSCNTMDSCMIFVGYIFTSRTQSIFRGSYATVSYISSEKVDAT